MLWQQLFILEEILAWTYNVQVKFKDYYLLVFIKCRKPEENSNFNRKLINISHNIYTSILHMVFLYICVCLYMFISSYCIQYINSVKSYVISARTNGNSAWEKQTQHFGNTITEVRPDKLFRLVHSILIQYIIWKPKIILFPSFQYVL